MQVHLIRHTKLDIGKGICYGQSDVPVANSFAEEKDRILQSLDQDYDMVYSSPLSRCSKLARSISSKQYRKDPRLLEMDFGDWEMKKWEDIDQIKLNAWMADFINIKPENGENLVEIYARVCAFIQDLLQTPHEKIAIITHAGVVRLFWAWILEIPLPNIFKLQIDYGEIFELNLDQNKDYCSIKSKRNQQHPQG